jgi:hypothetical protein
MLVIRTMHWTLSELVFYCRASDPGFVGSPAPQGVLAGREQCCEV